MRVTEQLDALTTLRTDAYRYLIAPRLFACVIALPIMVLIANTIGIMGGYLLAVYKLGFNPATYLASTRQYLQMDDVQMALVKAAVFGFIIAIMGLLQRLPHRRRRGRRRQGDDRCGGLLLHAHPVQRSHHHDRGVRLMAEPKIKLTEVAKRFGDKVVLDGVNLSVEPGESVAIIGGSGTGKSVTLKCILGLLTPDSGSVQVDGQEIAGAKNRELEKVRRKFGMLFQGGALFDSMPVWRNVTFGLTQGRMRHAAEMRKIAEENLERVGLGREILNLRPNELSGGMQKRVALARAIAPRPEVIFFDEPTTGPRSDPRRRDQRSDHQPGRRSRRHRAHDHPRHGVRPQDRTPRGDALQWPDRLARPARPAVR